MLFIFIYWLLLLFLSCSITPKSFSIFNISSIIEILFSVSLLIAASVLICILPATLKDCEYFSKKSNKPSDVSFISVSVFRKLVAKVVPFLKKRDIAPLPFSILKINLSHDASNINNLASKDFNCSFTKSSKAPPLSLIACAFSSIIFEFLANTIPILAPSAPSNEFAIANNSVSLTPLL